MWTYKPKMDLSDKYTPYYVWKTANLERGCGGSKQAALGRTTTELQKQKSSQSFDLYPIEM